MPPWAATNAARRGLPARFGARVLLACLAAAAGLWSFFALPVFWSETAIDKIGSRITAGERFRREALLALRPQIDHLEKQPRPTAESLHNIAMIEVRLAELDAAANKPLADDPQFARARNAVVTSLRAAPADAFLWLALFWLDKTRDGLSPRILPYLRMSYLVGENEGWVAAKRNAIAAPLLAVLPKDLADLAVREFRNLVASGFIHEAADILTGPGWGNHDRLIADLKDAPADAKKNLADVVYQLGFDVVIPGVEPHDPRPWK